ncbi:threonine aldolase [Vibrio sp. qd031]|uniref:threonine aldolase family protein n=1 Tax=Vibrio sp. qd031 TaxID=1603038 RepID=UPI000A109F54|nr:aminotransferase class I/II-fold pyridoxal phosphate-dependent enzyme [Vibrio sp. qd031]ORT49594.1 threonine aldolase [Vibrio sp. qd031]
MSQQFKNQCSIHIPGNAEPTPAEHFQLMATWCEKHNVDHDVYGDGATLQQFESKIATLLGYEAAMFVVSGTMTQPTLLEMVTQQSGKSNVVMHSSSHILLHENQGFQLQNRFNVLPVGHRFSPWTTNDLEQIVDPIAAVLYELPMREIGGQLPEWEELQEIKAHCRRNNIHMHMDGARLWECSAFYDKSYKEICSGFDTTYVSLYKGIGGMGGSMLCGSQSMINAAKVWMQRVGGNLYHRTPYVVSAMMQFDQRIDAMPALFKRTQELYQLLSHYPTLQPVPIRPNSNMLHLYLPHSYESAVNIRDTLAKEHGVWIGNPQRTDNPMQSKIEWYVGDNLLAVSNTNLDKVFLALS